MARIEMDTAAWRKSTRCGGSATCVEVAALPGGRVGARDTKRGPAGPALAISRDGWRTFVRQTRGGLFDLATGD
ncbi:DUF397 domain-containing protein [Actinomadura atramentaria]|uniref:DUF397 domain-containing protein n=1 Tax=Actinomadura atramentaria TaxID=1990 RepID=UPI00035E6278|nr:DUF397 domain-containing protein [Actinomadura atramentaria]